MSKKKKIAAQRHLEVVKERERQQKELEERIATLSQNGGCELLPLILSHINDMGEYINRKGEKSHIVEYRGSYLLIADDGNHSQIFKGRIFDYGVELHPDSLLPEKLELGESTHKPLVFKNYDSCVVTELPDGSLVAKEKHPSYFGGGHSDGSSEAIESILKGDYAEFHKGDTFNGTCGKLITLDDQVVGSDTFIISCTRNGKLAMRFSSKAFDKCVLDKNSTKVKALDDQMHNWAEVESAVKFKTKNGLVVLDIVSIVECH